VQHAVVSLEASVGLKPCVRDIVTHMEAQSERRWIVLSAQETVTMPISDAVRCQSLSGHRCSRLLGAFRLSTW
jgi:hypothetical protein